MVNKDERFPKGDTMKSIAKQIIEQTQKPAWSSVRLPFRSQVWGRVGNPIYRKTIEEVEEEARSQLRNRCGKQSKES